jgi:hypothetical protein
LHNSGETANVGGNWAKRVPAQLRAVPQHVAVHLQFVRQLLALPDVLQDELSVVQ